MTSWQNDTALLLLVEEREIWQNCQAPEKLVILCGLMTWEFDQKKRESTDEIMIWCWLIKWQIDKQWYFVCWWNGTLLKCPRNENFTILCSLLKWQNDAVWFLLVAKTASWQNGQVPISLWFSVGWWYRNSTKSSTTDEIMIWCKLLIWQVDKMAKYQNVCDLVWVDDVGILQNDQAQMRLWFDACC